MLPLSLPLKLLIAYFFGAVIGMERGTEAIEHEYKNNGEKSRYEDLGGVRVFSLISLLGAVAGYLSINNNTPLYLIIIVFFLLIVLIYYKESTFYTKSASLTTELAATFTFFIGYFITSEVIPFQYIVAMTVVISLTLSLKERLHTFYLGIKQYEINSFLAFALIALVILPLLPNKPFFLSDIPGFNSLATAYNIDSGFVSKLEIVNPQRLWYLVVLVTGIDVIGYIINRLAHNKGGVTFSGALGGFVSSTVTIFSLSQKSRDANISKTYELLAASMFANVTSYLPYFLLIAPINGQWLVATTPALFILLFITSITGFYFLKRAHDFKHIEQIEYVTSLQNPGNNIEQDIKERTVFKFAPALRFAVLLVLVRILTKTSYAILGEYGFIFSSMLASVAGLHAVVINLAEVAGGSISFIAALITLFLGILTNLFIKIIFSYSRGNRLYAKGTLVSTIFVISVSFICIGLMFWLS